jgi:hypothetical protein
MRRVHAALVGGVLGPASATAVVTLLAALWKSCDIGINDAANSLTLLYLYAPSVALTASTASAAVFLIVARGRWAKPVVIGYCAAVTTALMVISLALWVGTDFGADYPCRVVANSNRSPLGVVGYSTPHTGVPSPPESSHCVRSGRLCSQAKRSMAGVS